MDANQLIAISAVIGAATGLINSVVNAMTLAQGRRNAGAIQSVDSRVNGHLSALTEMVRVVDPATAAATAARVLETAREVRKPRVDDPET